MKRDLKKILKLSTRVYKKNFFRLSLSFVILSLVLTPFFIFNLIDPTFGPFGLGFQAFFFFPIIFCAGGVITDTRGAMEAKDIKFSETWRTVFRNLPKMYLAFLIVYLPWVTLLYFLFEYWSFFIAVPLLFLPFFSMYVLPDVFFTNPAFPWKSIANSFKITWENLIKSMVFFFPFLLVGIYLFLFGLWILVTCFLLPFWFVLITVAYMERWANRTPIKTKKVDY